MRRLYLLNESKNRTLQILISFLFFFICMNIRWNCRTLRCIGQVVSRSGPSAVSQTCPQRIICMARRFQLAPKQIIIMPAFGIATERSYMIRRYLSGKYIGDRAGITALHSNKTINNYFQYFPLIHRSHQNLINVYRRGPYNAQDDDRDITPSLNCCKL